VEKVRVMVVDDSPFSQRIIKDSLAGTPYEVVACADTGNDAVGKFCEFLPDVITMDLTLPDMDGLECCREILTMNPHAKIIILSAMKDEAIINRGTAIGVQAFLQKPVKKENLISAFKSVLNQGEAEESNDNQWLQYFEEAFTQNLEDMADLKGQVDERCEVGTKFISHGIAIIVGLTGTKQGRVIIDLPNDVAMEFSKRILRSDTISDDDLLNCIAEFANIVAGHGVSQLNNLYKDKEVEIRLTPPSILIGESLSIINPKLASCTVSAVTEIGDVHLNVGFVRGK
jgi:CheY-like chemotaxis protein/CheY-specific phosphatase CheX